MALETQIVPVPFAGGLDSKTDPFQVAAGKLLALENAVFTSPGKLRKRYGHTALSQTTATGSTISGGSFIASRGDELVMSDAESLFSWSETNQTWTSKGSIPWIHNRRQMMPTPAATTSGTTSVAVQGDLLAVTYEGTTTSRLMLWDSASDAVITDEAVAGAAKNAKVVAWGSAFLVVYDDGGLNASLYYRTVSTAGALGTATLLGVTISAPHRGNSWDATTDTSGNLVVGAFTGIVGDAYALKMTPAYAITGPVAAGGAVAGTAQSCSVNVSDTDGSVWVSYYTTAGANYRVHVSAWDSSLAVTLAVQLVELNATQPYGPTGGRFTTSGFKVYFSATEITSGQWFALTKTAQFTGTTMGAVSTLARLAPVSQPFSVNGKNYLLVGTSSTFTGYVFGGQATVFLLEELDAGGFTVVGKCLTGEADPAPDLRLASVPVELDQARFIYSVSAPSAVGPQHSPALVTFSFRGSGDPQSTVTLGDSLHISGSQVWMYDGESLVESGFHLYPDKLTVSASTTGGVMAAGTYTYQAIYFWVDGNGYTHYSSPVATAVTARQATTTGATSSVTVSVPMLPITNKSNVKVAIYRTEGAGGTPGTTFYLLGTIDNDPTTALGTYLDTVADATIITSAQLYTGVEVERVAPPACTALAVYKNRVLLVDAEYRLRIWYSQPVIPGQPVTFSDFFQINVDTAGGPEITGLAALDDKLVIFKRDVSFYLTGSGPDFLGLNNDFSAPTLINTNSGCITSRSIGTGANGVVYQSAKGWFILDRGLTDAYIGAGVEAYNSATSTGCVVVPGRNEVRWTLDSGVTLSYDYLVKQWSVFTGIIGAAATTWRGDFIFLRANGLVMYEDPTVFTDDGAAILLRIKTPWLNLAGLQGFQRVRKVLILGDYLGEHSLTATIRADYEEAPLQEITISAQDVMDGGTLASPFAFPLGAPATPAYQWRIHTVKQKVEALQVELQEVEAGTYSEGLSLSALTFEVGVKRGPVRLPAERSAG